MTQESHRTPISSEDEALAIIRRVIEQFGAAPDLSDDCAYLKTQTDLVSSDTLIEGKHFDLDWDSPAQVGRQIVVANASDICASGGRPTWLTWSLALGADWDCDMLEGLTRGCMATAHPLDLRLVGGNLSRTVGPTVINATVGGSLAGHRLLSRSEGRVGQLVYVSGYLGDPALGYRTPNAETRALRHAWRPHVNEAFELSQRLDIGACMDISDGLLIDAHRLSAASEIALHLESELIPVSDGYQRYVEDKSLALSGGEDYVLLFTADGDVPAPSWAHRIGHCIEGRGVYVDGKLTAPLGFDHFAREQRIS